MALQAGAKHSIAGQSGMDSFAEIPWHVQQSFTSVQSASKVHCGGGDTIVPPVPPVPPEPLDDDPVDPVELAESDPPPDVEDDEGVVS